MTKEEAIRMSSQLLRHIFHDDNGDPEKIAINANIITAEADNDVDFLCSALDNVIEFCDNLKKAMCNKQ